MSPEAAALAEGLRAARRPLVVTGAGMGLASGIATFRGKDPGAVWANDVTTKGTYAYFRADPRGSWGWYLGRFEGLHTARPNAGHHAVTALQARARERGAPLALVTQNIDGLHAAAGADAIEVHGAARLVRCARDGCVHGAPTGTLPFDPAAFAGVAAGGPLPTCPACGELLRPHVLWFDETYDQHASYRFGDVIVAARSADLVVFVGTSFSVGVTAMVVDAARRRGAAAWSVDPSDAAPPPGVRPLRLAQEVLLPELAAAVG